MMLAFEASYLSADTLADQERHPETRNLSGHDTSGPYSTSPTDDSGFVFENYRVYFAASARAPRFFLPTR